MPEAELCAIAAAAPRSVYQNFDFTRDGALKTHGLSVLA